MAIKFCWTQAASGAAGRANIGLCPASSFMNACNFFSATMFISCREEAGQSPVHIQRQDAQLSQRRRAMLLRNWSRNTEMTQRDSFRAVD